MAARILGILKYESEKPQIFGSFHIISLLLIAAVTIFLCLSFKNPSEKTAGRIIFIISLIVIIFEIYKQLVYCLDIKDGKIVFSYDWHIFPWQFCSTPMFAGLLAATVRNKRIHTALCSYLASYSLVAGLFISITGGNVFSRYVGINIQTMVNHGSMVALGIFLCYSGYIAHTRENFKDAVGVFLSGAVIAAVLNEAAYLIGIPEGEVFNLYFISPYFKEDVPMLTAVRRLIPDPFFQILYLTVFTALSAAVFFLKDRMYKSLKSGR